MLHEVGRLFVVAALATLGHCLVSRATAATRPAGFLQPFWATIPGDDRRGATSYISWRGSTGRGRALTPPAGATKM
jgi:hypothetical protein